MDGTASVGLFSSGGCPKDPRERLFSFIEFDVQRPVLGLFLTLSLSILPASAQAPIESHPLFDPAYAAPWAPAISAVSRWSATPAGVSLFGGDISWRSIPAPAAPPLAAGLEGLRQPGLARQLESIETLAPAQQQELVARLSDARRRAGLALGRFAEGNLNGAEAPGTDAPALKARVQAAQEAHAALDAVEKTGFYGEAAVAARNAAQNSLGRLRGLWAAAKFSESESLRDYIERTHQDLIRDHRELFLLKMKKAEERPFAFFRGFPGLLYSQAALLPQAAALKKTPELMLHGDPHVENIEIAESHGRRVPQFNDFDDSDRSPVGLDLVRMLVGACLGGNGSAKDCINFAGAAAQAYQESLQSDFRDWVKTLDREKSTSKAESRDRKWPDHAGRKILDPGEAARVLKAASLDPREWEVFDRRGAGISSIGMRRYMFVSKKRGYVFELKELGAPALGGFGQKLPGWTARERVQAAYDTLRQIPAQTRTLSADGADWLLHRRKSHEAGLNMSHPLSAARVVGGLLGQAHRGQGVSAEKLAEAARSIPLDRIQALAGAFEAFRGELQRFLKEGVWK